MLETYTVDNLQESKNNTESYNLKKPFVPIALYMYPYLYHAIENTNKSECRKDVVYSKVLHPTFSSCATLMSQ